MPPDHLRPAGDDVVIQVRVRRANLPALEEGVGLGVDLLTHRAIELRLIPRADGVHELELVTGPHAMAGAPEAVAAEIVDG